MEIDLRQLKRGFLYVAIGSVVIAAFVAISSLTVGSFSDTDGRILVTTLLLAWACSIGMACSTAAGKVPLLAGGGVVIAAAAFLLALAPIWGDLDGAWWQLPASLFVVGSAYAECLRIYLRSRPDDGASVVVAEVVEFVSLSVLTVMIVRAIVARHVGGTYWKALAVMAVIFVASALMTFLFRRLAPAVAASPIEPANTPAPAALSNLAGRTIVRTERIGSHTVIELDDGRRLTLET